MLVLLACGPGSAGGADTAATAGAAGAADVALTVQAHVCEGVEVASWQVPEGAYVLPATWCYAAGGGEKGEEEALGELCEPLPAGRAYVLDGELLATCATGATITVAWLD